MKTPDIIPNNDYRLIHIAGENRAIVGAFNKSRFVNNDPTPNWVTFAREISDYHLPTTSIVNAPPEVNTEDDLNNFNAINQHGLRYLNDKTYILSDNRDQVDKLIRYKKSITNTAISNHHANILVNLDNQYFNFIYLDALWENSIYKHNQYIFKYPIENMPDNNLLYDFGIYPTRILVYSGAFLKKGNIDKLSDKDYILNNSIYSGKYLNSELGRRIYGDGTIRGNDNNTVNRYYHHLNKDVHYDVIQDDRRDLKKSTQYSPLVILEGGGGIISNVKLRCLNHRHHPYLFLNGIVKFHNNKIEFIGDNIPKMSYLGIIQHKLMDNRYIPWKNRPNTDEYNEEIGNIIADRTNMAIGHFAYGKYNNVINNTNILKETDEYFYGNKLKKSFSFHSLPRHAYISLYNGDINKRNEITPYFGLMNWQDEDKDEIIKLNDSISVDNEVDAMTEVTICFDQPDHYPDRKHIFNIYTADETIVSSFTYPTGVKKYHQYPIIVNSEEYFYSTYMKNLANINNGYFSANTESIGRKGKIVNLPMNQVDEYDLYYFLMKERPFFSLNLKPSIHNGILYGYNYLGKDFEQDIRYTSRFILKAKPLTKDTKDIGNSGATLTFQYNNITIKMFPGDTIYPESIYPNCLRADRKEIPDTYNVPYLINNVTRKPEHHKRLGYLDHYYYCDIKDRSKTSSWLPQDKEFIPLIPINDGKLIDGNRTEGDVLAFKDDNYYLLPSGTSLINGGYDISRSDDNGNRTFYALKDPDSVLIEENRIKNLYRKSNIFKRLIRYHFPLRRNIGNNPNEFITHSNILTRMELVIDKTTMLITRHEVNDIFKAPYKQLVWRYDYYPFKEVIGPNGKEYDKVNIVNGFFVSGYLGCTYIPAKPGGTVVDFPIDLEAYIRDNFNDSYTPSDSMNDAYLSLYSDENKMEYNPRPEYSKFKYDYNNVGRRDMIDFSGSKMIDKFKSTRYYHYIDNVF